MVTEKRREQNVAWRRANKEKIDAQNAEYRAAHRDEIKERGRAYYAKNKEKIRAKGAVYAQRNKEKIAKRMATYYIENKDKRAEYAKRYAKENSEACLAIVHRRRARRAGSGGSHTAAERIAKFAEWFNRCYYCGTDQKLTVDHDIPLSRGGTDSIDNILPACRSCNSKKHTKTATEYIAHIGVPKLIGFGTII